MIVTKMRRPAVRGILLTTGTLAAIVLAGCQDRIAGSASAPLTTVVAPPAPMTTGSPTVHAPPTTSQAPIPETRTAPPSAAPSVTPECKAVHLELGLGPADGAAGHVYQSLEFTNKSRTQCVMAGFPGVSYVTGDTGQQVGAPAVWVDKAGPPVLVVPGQTVFATLVVTDVGVFDPDACRPTPVRGLRVYPPDETAAMYVDRPGTGCAGDPPSPQLRVYTIKKDDAVG